VHLVGFTIEIYCDARSYKPQILPYDIFLWLFLSFWNAWSNRWSCVGICRKFPLRQYAMEGISKRHLATLQWTGSICGCGLTCSCSMTKTHLKHLLFSDDPYANHILWTSGNCTQGNETKSDGDRTSGQRHFKLNILWKKSTVFRLAFRISVNYRRRFLHDNDNTQWHISWRLIYCRDVFLRLPFADWAISLKETKILSKWWDTEM
jgi:hypothetical protein